MEENNEQKKKINIEKVAPQTTEAISFENRLNIAPIQESIYRIKQQLGKVIVGQKDMVELLIVALLADGHALIEGVPGVAKTVSAKLLSKTMDVGFSRIQFTPDLMPSDILGTSVFNVKTSEFEFKKGPIFSNMILIDEINRAPAKTQAALFEVMEEQQITIDGTTYALESPFIVLATQNPIEQEGTYRLPEAQLDRFLFKIEVDYPQANEEIEILDRAQNRKNESMFSTIEKVLSATDIEGFKKTIQEISVESKLLKYIADIVVNTRTNSFLYLGASPRASIAILNTSKVFAAMAGRDFVTPEDIKKASLPVLRHRVIVTPEREMEGVSSNQIIAQITESIEIPR